MASEEESFELVELEYTEDDIAYYIEDEDGNELGFAILDEAGNEVEYYYDEADANAYEEVAPAKPKRQTAPKAKEAKEESLAYLAGSMAGKAKTKAKTVPDKIDKKKQEAKDSHKKEELKEAASDLNEIYHAGKEVTDELKAAYDDIAGVLDFIPGKKFKKLKR